MIVIELRALGHKVYDEDFSHKFLRCLPSRFDTLVTIIVRGGFDNLTPTQVLLEVVTQDTFHQENVENEKEKKNKDESSDDDSSSSSIDDAAMALFVRKFGKMLKKKGYKMRSSKSSSKRCERIKMPKRGVNWANSKILCNN